MAVLPSKFNTFNDRSKRRSGARRAAGTDPNGPIIGDTYFNTTNKVLYIWDGSAWIPLSYAEQYRFVGAAGGTTSGTTSLTQATVAIAAQGVTYSVWFEFNLIGSQSVVTDAFEMTVIESISSGARHFRFTNSVGGNYSHGFGGLFAFSAAQAPTLTFAVGRQSGTGTLSVSSDARFSNISVRITKSALSF